MNSLRAAILGADDGIVSVAGIVLGVAGATTSRTAIFAAGLAGLVAGSLSMAAGEFISVSSQKDTEQMLLEKERWELETYPKEEFAELQQLYENKGLSPKTAKLVASELTKKDAFAAHIDVELNIDPDDLSNPWQAAVASAASFFIGAVIPLLTIVLTPSHERVYVTFIAVLVALTLTGYLSASFSKTNELKSTIRVVIGGALAMVVTYVIGHIFGNKVL